MCGHMQSKSRITVLVTLVKNNRSPCPRINSTHSRYMTPLTTVRYKLQTVPTQTYDTINKFQTKIIQVFSFKGNGLLKVALFLASQ